MVSGEQRMQMFNIKVATAQGHSIFLENSKDKWFVHIDPVISNMTLSLYKDLHIVWADMLNYLNELGIKDIYCYVPEKYVQFANHFGFNFLQAGKIGKDEYIIMSMPISEI